MTKHAVVSSAEWIEARKRLLVKEKALTRLRDELNQARRDLPWERVDKPYVLVGEAGERALAEVFDGRSQLVVYHAMFAPEDDAACPHCSAWMDNLQGPLVHLNHHDVTLVAVSRAPYAKLAAYRRRMGWQHPWYSSGESSFNYDLRVSFTPEQLEAHGTPYNYDTLDPEGTDREGVSVFFKDDSGTVFHTYSAYARGIDMISLTYHYLDLVPKGRDEAETGPGWVRRHDEYGV